MTFLADFYVYAIFRPDGVPCYIGKGRGRRWTKRPEQRTNQHLARIAERDGELPVAKVSEGLTEEQAIDLERRMISILGRVCDGGLLVNVTLGGGGVAGLRHSEASKSSISAKLTGIRRSAETRERMSAAQKGHHVGANARELVRAAMLGTAHHITHHSDETKARLRAATTAQFADVARREKHRLALVAWNARRKQQRLDGPKP